MTAELLRQGTKTRNAQQIAKTIDSSGGNLGSAAGSDTASAECTMMKASADLGLELLADIVINPTFPQDEVDRLMRQTPYGRDDRGDAAACRFHPSHSDPQEVLPAVPRFACEVRRFDPAAFQVLLESCRHVQYSASYADA